MLPSLHNSCQVEIPEPLDNTDIYLYNRSMENKQQTGRTRGRVPGTAAGTERVKTTLLLDLDTVEWGKHQPGGLSELLRALLRQAMETKEAMEQKGGGTQ